MEAQQQSQGLENPDDALLRLTTSLRAGLPGSRMGAGLFSRAIPPGADPFEFFRTPEGRTQDDATVQRTQDLPRESLSADAGAAATVDRRVALMTQDMAAFGGVGREASLRLHTPAEDLRVDYFA